MTSEQEYDVLVLGGGPGGYVAAIRAAQLGLNVAVVEKDSALGGTCLHRGCIPTKALLHYTETLEKLAHCADFGLNIGGLESIDMTKMHASKNKIVKRMSQGIGGLMKKNNITVVQGRGKLVGERKVQVGEETITAKNVILATGSRPAALPFLKPDGVRTFTSDEILKLESIPKSMVVLGAGAVGLEFACVYKALGTG